MADPAKPPKGECRQCWRHANDPSVHRGNTGDCPDCVAHMGNRHPDHMIVR